MIAITHPRMFGREVVRCECGLRWIRPAQSADSGSRRIWSSGWIFEPDGVPEVWQAVRGLTITLHYPTAAPIIVQCSREASQEIRICLQTNPDPLPSPFS